MTTDFARIHDELAEAAAELASLRRQVQVLTASTRQTLVRLDRLEAEVRHEDT